MLSIERKAPSKYSSKENRIFLDGRQYLIPSKPLTKEIKPYL